MPEVSVIIVNYNGRHLLGELFESLARQTRPADEVIMVDNASSDGSVDYVREHFAQTASMPSSDRAWSTYVLTSANTTGNSDATTQPHD